jgi:hypothetical protein
MNPMITFISRRAPAVILLTHLLFLREAARRGAPAPKVLISHDRARHQDMSIFGTSEHLRGFAFVQRPLPIY